MIEVHVFDEELRRNNLKVKMFDYLLIYSTPYHIYIYFYPIKTMFREQCHQVVWNYTNHKTLGRVSDHWYKTRILIHYVCNAHFHWLWRRKFAALKSLRLCHESSDDVTSLATRRSNGTKTFWKSVLSDWIRMVITLFVIEWFADINCIILRSQIPVLPLRWRVAVKLNLRPYNDTIYVGKSFNHKRVIP